MKDIDIEKLAFDFRHHDSGDIVDWVESALNTLEEFRTIIPNEYNEKSVKILSARLIDDAIKMMGKDAEDYYFDEDCFDDAPLGKLPHILNCRGCWSMSDDCKNTLVPYGLKKFVWLCKKCRAELKERVQSGVHNKIEEG